MCTHSAALQSKSGTCTVGQSACTCNGRGKSLHPAVHVLDLLRRAAECMCTAECSGPCYHMCTHSAALRSKSGTCTVGQSACTHNGRGESLHPAVHVPDLLWRAAECMCTAECSGCPMLSHVHALCCPPEQVRDVHCGAECMHMQWQGEVTAPSSARPGLALEGSRVRAHVITWATALSSAHTLCCPPEQVRDVHCWVQ